MEEFDVSGKRNVDIVEYIEDFLNNPVNRNRLISHKRKIGEWKKEQQEYVDQCFLKKRRQRQFLESIDDKHAFQFVTTRKQTRYRQQNYYRTSYTVHQEDDWLYVDWQWLVNKDRELMAINHETTLKKYHSQKQRNLMTPQLREEIMKRDNNTCQICGKFMPDGVGLQIDHIVPVAKGGKTIPSNLQVLCSKCNASKRDKIVPPSKVKITHAESVQRRPVVNFPDDPEESEDQNTMQVPVVFPEDPDEFDW